MKIKVLTIVKKLNLGGIERTLLSSLPLLKKRQIEIHVLCSQDGVLDKEFVANGAILHHFNKSRNPINDAVFLYQLLKNEKFDIVHSREGHTSGFLVLACSYASVPIVVSVHSEKSSFKLSWQESFTKSKIRQLYLNLHKYLTLRYSSLIIGHSKANLSYYNYKKLPSASYRLVYNGIDFSKFDQQSEVMKNNEVDSFLINASVVFLHVGSFRTQKNHSFLLNVFSKLNPVKNNYKLILVGEGSLRQEMTKRVQELGLEKNVYFTGLASNVDFYLKKANIFFFPSIHEGFGNVLIEAQYNHLLIAASNIKPHFESVYSGYHQYFFDPFKIEESKDKILELICEIDTVKLNQIKNEAFLFSTKFSIENMVDELVNCYSDVLGKRL